VAGLSTNKNVEFAPTISADGKKVIFESNKNPKKGWELFESSLDANGLWRTPVPLTAINENCNFIAGPSISYDGNKLYYTAFIEGSSQSEDIYYSERVGESQWSKPINIGSPINTDDNYEGFPSISSDGSSLFFIRITPETGIAKKDKEPCFTIYLSKKMADGKWGEPVALPAPINTGCERDPKIMADNHTLIFSSIRGGGKGKYDMYQSTWKEDGSWTEPVAFDFINSTENDQSPCISASGSDMMYYTNDDIYTISMPEKFRQMVNSVVQGKVLSEKTKAPVIAQINVFNLSTNESFITKNNSVDGAYSIVLNAGSNYKITFDNEQYLLDSLIFDLKDQKTFQLVTKDVSLLSTFQVSVDIFDKDIKKSVSAWLHIQQGIQDVYKDSIDVAKLPMQLSMESPLDYKLQFSKRGYKMGEERLLFKKVRITSNRNFKLFIDHEKVRFVANVSNVTTKQKVKVKVYYQNKEHDELIISEAGETVLLRKGDKYQIITASEEGYFFTKADVIAGQFESIEMHMVPIELNAKLTLNDITFETNSAELRSTSQFELDRIVDLMHVNPKLAIEISAHTDDIGDEKLNLKLSEKRAQSAWEYLKSKGVHQERLLPKGYGENAPAVPNDTDENRAKNRRVELRVLKIS
jgi:outer membrane protein OmpA-like peptidoglycan-associated protein